MRSLEVARLQIERKELNGIIFSIQDHSVGHEAESLLLFLELELTIHLDTLAEGW